MTDQKFERLVLNVWTITTAVILTPMVVLVLVMIVKSIIRVAQS